MIINKKNVRNSIWVPIPVVFLFLIIVGLIGELGKSKMFDPWDVLVMAFFGILVGAVVWLPSLIICLIIEEFHVKESTTKMSVKKILIIEACVPAVIFSLFGTASINGFFTLLGIGVCFTFLAQLIRWFYLKKWLGLYEIETN